MSRFMSLILNALLIIGLFMGVFGWFWLPNMLNGNWPGPYALLVWYIISIPLVIGISLIFLVMISLYRFVILLVMQGKGDATSLLLRNKILSLLIVSIIGGFPSYIGNFDTLQKEAFGGRHYQLLMQHTPNYASFSVFNCFEPIGVWCQNEIQTPRLTPPYPTPTPMSNFVIVIDNNPINLRPPALPTVTPPAELLLDTTGVGLLLKVGAEYAVVTTIVPTPTPVDIIPPEVMVTIAPSVTPYP